VELVVFSRLRFRELIVEDDASTRLPILPLACSASEATTVLRLGWIIEREMEIGRPPEIGPHEGMGKYE
jgi:hypothetical protein